VIVLKLQIVVFKLRIAVFKLRIAVLKLRYRVFKLRYRVLKLPIAVLKLRINVFKLQKAVLDLRFLTTGPRIEHVERRDGASKRPLADPAPRPVHPSCGTPNASVAIIEAAIAVGFGLDWTAEQVGLLMVGVVAIGKSDQDHLGARAGDAGGVAEG